MSPARVRPTLVLLILCAVTAASPPAAAGQTTLEWDPRGAEMGRQELEELVERLESAANSSGYSQRLREQARREAEVVRARLEEGDFQVGDRVAIQVEGEPEIGDTLVVGAGRVLTLPDMDPIPLDGVLRSELQSHLERELGRYLQDPIVRASSLVRIAVLGQVGSQGFYTMPASLLIEEALMRAGGPTQNADLDKAEILRGDRVIWRGDALKEAIIAGRTLDQLSLRAGDRIMVPGRSPGFFSGGVIRTLLVTLPAISFAIYRIARLF